jgi:hypothetical protein
VNWIAYRSALREHQNVLWTTTSIRDLIMDESCNTRTLLCQCRVLHDMNLALPIRRERLQAPGVAISIVSDQRIRH